MTRYLQPERLVDAARMLSDDPSLLIVAGATDVYPALTSRVGWGGAKSLPPVLDLSRVAELRGIEDRGDHWWIGAMTTWTDIARADYLPPLFDGLKAAAREIGGVQIQNRGTIAGNLCTASPAGDSIPCLLALDADVACVGGTEFRVPLDKFITAYRKTALAEGELVTGVHVPKHNGRGHFLKLGARRYLVISIAMVAGVFDLSDDGRVTSARLAVGACAPVAQRLPRLEARMIGAPLGHIRPEPEDLARLAPIDDVRASGAYRKAAALQLVADLIDDAARLWRPET
jgi:CO/xanthine dehydrogenase FAD-binding subunit